MDTERPLRVGIVGCGRVAIEGWGHIPALKKIRNVNLAAVCDMNENLAKKVAGQFHVDRYYADLSEMLKNEKLDIMDICTQPSTHLSLSVAAMEAGCHVLVEKLMAQNTKEADEMIKAAKENKVKLCVVHNKLFQPMVMKARSIVNEGAIGDLTGIDLRTAWSRDSSEIVGAMNKDHWYYKLPCGVFGEMLPHEIYLAIAFLGNLEPVAVYARKLDNYEWVSVDELRIILESEKGIGTITASCNWPKGMATLDLFGKKRNLHVSIHNGLLFEYGAGKESRPRRALDNLSQSYKQLACTASIAFNTMLGKHHSGHHTLIEKFAESILNDTAPPVPGEEGREVVRLLEKIDALTKTSLRGA
jgi:predicted dehydrogenase